MGRVADSWTEEPLAFPEQAAEAVPEKPKPYTVSAAMQLAKTALEGVRIRLLGEVSELSNKRGYKAVYFTVKDEGASLPCMMWVNRYEASGVELRVGQRVEIAGRFSLYAPKGRMSFDVSSIQLAGEGDLRMKVARLASQLALEGLTAPERKRALPVFPERIGLVTSPRGAAVHDVLRTLRRRYPMARVLFAGVPVEGTNAPAGIIQGIRCVCNAGAQVVLVVRGGGSFEDLMPFNDESLAREIAACPVPVVTGIGHEPDTTIADLVSDRRASTPTAAAEAVAPSMQELLDALRARATRMHGGFSRRLERSSLYIQRYQNHPLMKDSMQLFATEAQHLDLAGERLRLALPRAVEANGAKIDVMQQRLDALLGAALVQHQTRVETAQARLAREGSGIVPRFASQVSLGAARLQDLSPLTILSRGYAIARDGQGAVVRSAAAVSPGSEVNVFVADGVIHCRAEQSQITSKA